MRLAVFGLITILLSVPVLAQNRPSPLPRDQGPVRFGDASFLTDVSGTASDAPSKLEARGPDGQILGLYGARFLEKSDEPCHVVGLFEQPAATTVDGTDVWTACGGGRAPNASSLASIGFGDVAGQDRRAFVTSVEVCINNNKIKGVRFAGVRITQRGRVRQISPRPTAIAAASSLSYVPNKAEPSSPLFWRRNCTFPGTNKWRPAVACQEGKAATALLIHHFAAAGFTNRRQVTGLQLECRTVIGLPPVIVPSTSFQ